MTRRNVEHRRHGWIVAPSIGTIYRDYWYPDENPDPGPGWIVVLDQDFAYGLLVDPELRRLLAALAGQWAAHDGPATGSPAHPLPDQPERGTVTPRVTMPVTDMIEGTSNDTIR